MLIEAGGIRIIDSLNFLPVALSELPAMFGITDVKKGYFPHLFNTRANKDYVGCMPDIKYYSPDTMNEKSRENFLKWYAHEKQIDSTFNLQKDLLEYCVDDVMVLAKCCMKFRDIFVDISAVDPFSTSLTIASACNRVFRRNFLKENSIGDFFCVFNTILTCYAVFYI